MSTRHSHEKIKLSSGSISATSFLIAGAMLGLALLPAPARAQEKSTPMNKIVRLNRAPVNKEVLHIQLPKPAVTKLSNGLTLVLLEDHKLPTVTLTLWIRPGQLADPSDLPGLAAFTADMLTEGTAHRTSDQIAGEVDSLGASLSAASRFGTSYTAVNASGLVTDASQILDLVSDIVLHPSFPEAELAKYKQRAQADLEQQLSDPSFLARQAFRRVVYGEGPLAVSSATKDSIARVTAADLKTFHDAHYRAGNSILGVAGDFHADQMRSLIEKYFGAWSGAAEPPLHLRAAATSGASQITLVDRPDSVQTYIVAGDRGIRRTDPDYYALTVMDQVEGGGPQARLFLDLREEHSLTYGAYSRASAETYPGDWSARSPVRTQVTAEALDRFLYEFKKINDEPVPGEELGEAQRTIVAGFALSLEQPAQLLLDDLTVEYYGLPKDYWEEYPDRISAVDAAAVQAAARKYIDVAHMQWICVGDRKKIEDVLAKYGRVRVVDVAGNPEN
jgi:zinc protease